jgi:two-component system cell cycle sensor histidine kinase/response regulator CckA
VQKVTPTLRRLISEGISLQTGLSANLPFVLADPRVVESVLLHLVLNARAAMPQRGTLTISTTGVRVDAIQAERHPDVKPGPFVRLTVRDTGCGMSPEVQTHLFEPFFTTHDVGGGTGLGLASVYGAIKQHSGWIEFSTEEGVGTEFSVFFPCAPPSAVPAVPKVEAAPGATRETILLVEPAERARSLARFVLSHQGYRVIEADSAATALTLWESLGRNVDLLLTDSSLTNELSGKALAERLVQNKPGLKVVFASESAPAAETGDAPLSESLQFIPKPYVPEKLLKGVEQSLVRGRLPSGGET